MPEIADEHVTPNTLVLSFHVFIVISVSDLKCNKWFSLSKLPLLTIFNEQLYISVIIVCEQLNKFNIFGIHRLHKSSEYRSNQGVQ